MSSYEFSQQHNVQTVLWAIGGAVYQAAATVGNAYQAAVAALPALRYRLGLLAKALGLVAILVAGVALVAMIPPTFWLGLAITGALAYAGYPRPRKLFGRCTRCGSRHISGGMGHWDCDDCGRGGSY